MSLEFNPSKGLYLPEDKKYRKDKPLSINEVEQIFASESKMIKPETVEQYIEKPLVEAVRRLVFKNIPTITSSANKEGKEANLAISYGRLSNPNQHIANDLIKKGVATIVKNYRGSSTDILDITMDAESDGLPYNKIEQHYIAIADRFFAQKPAPEELKINEIEEYLAKMLGFNTVEEMRSKKSPEDIEEYVDEIKGRFDWTENPLVGKRK